jgi:hypothetical protein
VPMRSEVPSMIEEEIQRNPDGLDRNWSVISPVKQRTDEDQRGRRMMQVSCTRSGNAAASAGCVTGPAGKNPVPINNNSKRTRREGNKSTASTAGSYTGYWGPDLGREKTLQAVLFCSTHRFT